MIRYCTIISIALLTGLFIYIIYRTNHTEVNILLQTISHGKSESAILFIRKQISLPEWIIYSLPEGLWVFSATLVSKHLYIPFKRFWFPIATLPMIYAFLLEWLQLWHWMPGSFDWTDILIAVISGCAALFLVKCPLPKQKLFQPVNYRFYWLLYIYAIVFLSHVKV